MIFKSINSKFVSLIRWMLVLSMAGFLLTEIGLNLVDLQSRLEQTEVDLTRQLIRKGKTLVINNSHALKGMAEEHSFMAIRELVLSTVKEDSDLRCGIFMDAARRPWVIATPAGLKEETKAMDDLLSLWAGNLRESDYREVDLGGTKIIEVAAPVFSSTDEKLGTIRYDLSTASLRSAIERTRSELVQRFLFYPFLLLAIGLAIFFVGSRMARSRAGTITNPLKALTRAADEMSGGNYRTPVRIESDDEVGILASAFESMRQKIGEYTESLKRKEEDYRNLYETASVGLFRTRVEDGLLLKANHAALAMFGYSSQAEALADNFRVADCYPLEERDKYLTLLRKDKFIFPVALHLVFKDGREIDTELAARLNSEEGYLECSIRDVTELKKAEAELRKTEQQLIQAQKMETVGNLAGGLAHDFNNILMGISGSVSLMEYSFDNDEAVDVAEMKMHVGMIKTASERAAEMIKQLLSLTRKHGLALAPMDLNQAIKHVVAICGYSFDKSIEIQVRYSDDLAIVNADSTQVEQALLNLCVNACHAMTVMRKENELQGGVLSLSLGKMKADERFCKIHSDIEPGDYWVVAVSDTGVGMKAETLGRIFDPFFTTKDRFQGSGLGMTMVYNIAKSHKGMIDVYSEVGVGTTCKLYIPAMSADTLVTPVGIEKETVVRGKGTVLIVDDEDVVRVYAQAMLEECGYRVLTAADGNEALLVFREKREEIDSVLLDMSMPRMSGLEVFQELIQIDPDVKVLMSSGFINDERMGFLIDAGVKGFLNKPYTLTMLSKKMWEVITGEPVPADPAP